MSHLDRQTTDWSWTREGREKSEERESGVVKVVKSHFYFFIKQQQLPTTLGKKILAARRGVKLTTYYTTASFHKKHEPFTLQFARFGGSQLYLSK